MARSELNEMQTNGYDDLNLEAVVSTQINISIVCVRLPHLLYAIL